jgi:hypothetical protein
MVDTAPELDHIIPLASGGAHVWDNVQCTCRKCNGEKGAEVLGQLRLGLNGIVERSIEVDVVRGVTQHIRSWPEIHAAMIEIKSGKSNICNDLLGAAS